jgi:hypothetical protein
MEAWTHHHHALKDGEAEPGNHSGWNALVSAITLKGASAVLPMRAPFPSGRDISEKLFLVP